MNSDLPLVNQNPDYLEVAAFIYVIWKTLIWWVRTNVTWYLNSILKVHLRDQTNTKTSKANLITNLPHLCVLQKTSDHITCKTFSMSCLGATWITFNVLGLQIQEVDFYLQVYLQLLNNLVELSVCETTELMLPLFHLAIQCVNKQSPVLFTGIN